MYRIDFLQFNELKQEVMSEEDTLQNIIDIWFNCKPNKEQKNILQMQKNGLNMPLKTMNIM
jgi:hypothetical protein